MSDAKKNRSYEMGSYWLSQIPEINKYLKHEYNSERVMDILDETESDIIVEGENPYLTAFRALQAIDEEAIAIKFIKDLI